jgi:MoaA/NifB/PqqE/SkfB family radical SAM enzyme
MKQQSMSLETFEAIIDNVNDIQHIQMQGEGEPLLNPNLFTMMRMVRERFPQAIISMYTNGSLFTSKIIDSLIAVQVNSIYISMESAVAETFNKIRGGNLPRVIQGIQALMTHARPMRPEVGLAVTVLKETIQEIVPITKLYRDLGLDGGITIQPLNTMDAYTPVYDDHMIDQLLTRDDMDEFHNILQQNPEAKAVLDEKPSIQSFHTHLSQDTTPGCPWLSKGAYVSADGTACSCCFIKDPGQGFGDFTTKNVNPGREALQEHLIKGIMPDQCKGCSIADRLMP